MKKIALISDTHGRLDERILGILFEEEPDLIIHAGDICGPSVLQELANVAPVIAVLGNNDFDEYGEDVQLFAHPVVDGVRFLVGHIPRDVQIGFNGCRALSAGDPIPDVIVHGHTHVPRLEYGPAARPAQFIVNPGSAFRPRSEFGRTIGFIKIDAGAVKDIRIVDLDGKAVLKWPEEA